VAVTPDTPDTPKRCQGVRQLARYWRCAPKRVRELARRGILRGFQVGRALRFTPEAVAEAERLLAAPPAADRRRKPNPGIDRAVAALLEEAGG
jgi:hypothetical protein